MNPNILRLYAITDSEKNRNIPLEVQVESAIRGGVTCVQLREKNKTSRQILEIAERIGSICRRYQVPFIVNDSPEIAALCGADGVHIGQSDGDIKIARKIIGYNKILGVTAKTINLARQAEHEGADYIGCGAAFGTVTKSDATVISHRSLFEIVSSISIPVVAIGGINKDNISLLDGSGISGVAIADGIFGNADIEGNSRILKSLAEKIVKNGGE